MSKEYEGQDLLNIAAKAEQDLTASKAKGLTRKDPGGSLWSYTAENGSHASEAGSNRDFPPEEGGDFQKDTGRMTKAGDFDQGAAGEGPEDMARRTAKEHGGEDVVRN